MEPVQAVFETYEELREEIAHIDEEIYISEKTLELVSDDTLKSVEDAHAGELQYYL